MNGGAFCCAGGMKRKNIICIIMLIIALTVFAGCTKSGSKENDKDASAPNKDFIVVGSSNEEGDAFILYNTNIILSVEDLAEYIDEVYDFENKPEIILAESDAEEELLNEIKEMLDDKGVVYAVTDTVTDN